MNPLLVEIHLAIPEDIALKADKLRVLIKVTVMPDNEALLVCHYPVIKADIMNGQSS